MSTAERGGGSARWRLGGILVVEVGLAVALGLVALAPGLLPVAGVVLSAALVAGLVRVRGELVGTWAVLVLRHRLRESPAATEDGGVGDADGDRAPGGLDLGALDAALGEVVVVDGRDHDGRPVAFAGADDGTWSAVLAPDAEERPLLLDPAGADAGDGGPAGLPLAALAGTLSDRGVVLDALTLVRHLRPGGPDSPARQAHRDVLGPLTDAAHRSVWLVVRLDPRRCPGAIAERGGGELGARRALVGALARISRVLADHDLPVRPLDRDGLRDAVATAAVTGPEAAPDADGAVTERWDAVVVGEVGHATWTASDLRLGVGTPLRLDDLAAPDAATTVALALLPDGTGPRVGVAARVRVSARTPDELVAAGHAIVTAGRARGVRLDPQHGRQAAALRATLPGQGLPAMDPWGHPGRAAAVDVPATALDALVVPAAPAGIVLGADPVGAPVTLALLRPVPTRVVVLGALHLARQIALRAAGQGARLTVTTGRRAAWEPVARAAADRDLVHVGADEPPDDDGVPRPGDVEGLLAVHDRGATAAGPPPPRGPWRTTLLVLPALSPAVADAADDADVVLLGRMPPQEADLAARLWRLTEPMAETLRTLPDHGVVVLGRNLWRRLDLVTAERETALLGPVRRA